MNIAFNTYIRDVVYYILKDGSIQCDIVIDAFYLDDGTKFDRFSSTIVTNAGELNLTRGDHVRIQCNGFTDPTITITLLDLVPGRRDPLTPHICPICGSVLSLGSDGVHRCQYRGCAGQVYNNLTRFTDVLGLNSDSCPSWGAVFSALVNSGIASTPADIFRLDPSVVGALSDHLTTDDVAVYQRHTHLIRGHVTIGKLLKSLNIPNWMDTSYEEIDRIFQQNNWSLLDVDELFKNNVSLRYSHLDWKSFYEFMNITGNRNILNELATILHR